MGRFLFYSMFPHDFSFSNYMRGEKPGHCSMLLSGRVASVAASPQ